MQLLNDLIGLIYPDLCPGCGRHLLKQENGICLHCRSQIKRINFNPASSNKIEMLMWGRFPIYRGTAFCVFKKDSIVQKILHDIKYHGNKKLAVECGRMMGNAIKDSELSNADYLIPVPLHKKKEKQRGYNQSLLIAEGVKEECNIAIADKILLRSHYNISQTKTHVGAYGRWVNSSGIFTMDEKLADSLKGRHILLIDDVITSGSTIEACCRALQDIDGLKISFLCFAAASDKLEFD